MTPIPELDSPELSGAFEHVRKSVVTSSALKPYVTLSELELLCTDEDLQECFDELAVYCIRYTIAVSRTRLAVIAGKTGEELSQVDRAQRQTHEAVMAAINAMARALKRAGKPCEWVAQISGNRAAYAKLALLLAFERLELYGKEQG